MSKLTKTNTKAVDAKIREFISCIDEGKNALIKASKIYVQLLNVDPAIGERIIREYPAIQYTLLNKLEAVGRGIMDANLLLLPEDRARVLAKVPVEDQARYTTESIPVAKQYNGEWAVKPKRVDQMTHNEFRAAFDGSKIRRPEEQIKWHQEVEVQKKERDRRYYVQGDRIHFFAGSDFTLAELEDLVRRHKVNGFQTIEADMKKGQVVGR